MANSKELIEFKEIREFSLPCFTEITDVGLYLKQVVKYINSLLEPFFGISVTETMLSNYVKMGLVSNPIKKQYSREQIACLIFITVTKNAISLDNVAKLLEMEAQERSIEETYSFFSDCLKSELFRVFEVDMQETRAIKQSTKPEKSLLGSVLTAVAHGFYLSRQFMKVP